jgi:hypothetical protein
MNHVLYIQTNVVFADVTLISKRKGKKSKKKFTLYFLGYIYDKCHKPSVPSCLRYPTHECRTDDQNIDF